MKAPGYRRRFFRLRAHEHIAQQIRELRETRGLRQVDLARQAGMKQSAVSRIEQAEYRSWTLRTLLRVADALDAQLTVTFEPSEDVISRYERDADRAEPPARILVEHAPGAEASTLIRRQSARLPPRSRKD